MTTKKALQIIDYVLERKIQVKSGYLDPEKSWNKGTNVVSGFSKQIAKIIEDDVKILSFVRKELIPKCNHPKEMQDIDSKGNRYCMNCNWDL